MAAYIRKKLTKILRLGKKIELNYLEKEKVFILRKGQLCNPLCGACVWEGDTGMKSKKNRLPGKVLAKLLIRVTL